MRLLSANGLFVLVGIFSAGIARPAAGDPPVVNDGYGDYALVPAGPFQMGDNFNEGNERERPVHVVELDSYYIGKYNVTNAEYKKFRDDPGYNDPRFWPEGKLNHMSFWWTNEPNHGGGLRGNENYPVVGITWEQAVAYSNWLSAKTGKKYRLPPEAEWEKAARGTGQRRYPWGNQIDASYTNFSNSGGPYKDTVPHLNPVGFYDGSKRGDIATHSNASPYGAYDMLGGTFQWCQDWYSRNYYAFSARKNPQGPPSGAYRVLRGVGWYLDAPAHRATARFSALPSGQSYNLISFRCVRER